MFQKKIKILILLLYFSVATLNAESSAIEDINEGNNYSKENNCNKAIQSFASAIRKNPNSIEAKLGYAKCSFQLGATSESKKYFLEILGRDKKHIQAVSGISEIYLLEKNYKAIEDLLAPLLSEFPNNIDLKITEAKLLQAQGKLESAIFKLKNLSEKLGSPSSLEYMLGELYFNKEDFKSSLDHFHRYSLSLPDQPLGFVSKAKVLLYENYFYPSRLKAILPEVDENLTNALNIDQRNEAARFYKIYFEIVSAHLSEPKNEVMLRKAFRNIYELAREFPENKLYHMIEANLAWDLGEDKFAGFHYRRALAIDDLDEVLRFEAEEYTLNREKEEQKLRRELGQYRKERYFAEKQSLHPKSALFHLFRARNLSSQTPAIRRELLDFYDKTGESIKFINLLIRIRDEAPNQYKLENKLEFAIKSLKDSIEYKEGYIQIESNQVLENTIRHSPEVFVYDFESKVAFPDHLRAGRLIAEGLKYQLTHIQKVRLPSSQEESKIRSKLKETNFHPFSGTIPFSIDSLPALDIERRNKPKIRYVLHGSYSYIGNDLKLSVMLYDRVLLKDILFFNTSQRGRDALPTLLARVGERVLNELPKEGKILKINREDVVISLGKDDGLTKNDTIQLVRKGDPFLTGKIVSLGKSICLMKPDGRGWEKLVATGDDLFVKKEKK